MLMTEDTEDTTREEDADMAIVEFAAPSVAVLEKDKRVKVTIIRRGNIKKPIVFK